MKENYSTKITQLRSEIIDSIKRHIKEKGVIKLYDFEELNFTNEIYDLPQAFFVDKYNYFEQYWIFKISEEGVLGIGNDNAEYYTFDFEQVNTEELAHLLDLINK